MSDIVIYTENYPFGRTEIFLETEITYLSGLFDSVYLMPLKSNGDPRPVPSNVRILKPISINHRSLFIYTFGLLHLYLMLVDKNIRSCFKKANLRYGIKYLGYGLLIKKIIEKNTKKDVCIHYSYWLNYSAFAISMMKHQKKIKTVISRAHGYDLYEERGEKGLDFIKPYILSNIDRVFLISEHGLNYLNAKYPGLSAKFSVSKLGTTDPEFLNPSNNSDCLSLVSCSAVSPVKRIPLIIEALKLLNLRYQELHINWDHLGGGEGLKNLSENAAIKGENIRFVFHGNKKNAEIFEFYRSHSLDVFLNTSASEGLPVAIMEAQSCGIPVIATAVGGTPEIVNNQNGHLLSPNPAVNEIADALYDVYINKKNVWLKKRELSRKNWEENFTAEKNYRAFAQELQSLANTK